MALVKSKNWKNKTGLDQRTWPGVKLSGDDCQQRKVYKRWGGRAEEVGEVLTSHSPPFLCEVGCISLPYLKYFSGNPLHSWKNLKSLPWLQGPRDPASAHLQSTFPPDHSAPTVMDLFHVFNSTESSYSVLLQLLLLLPKILSPCPFTWQIPVHLIDFGLRSVATTLTSISHHLY